MAYKNLKRFVAEWHQYLYDLQAQTNTESTEDKRLGKKLDSSALDKMNDAMIERLWDLRTEIKSPIATTEIQQDDLSKHHDG
ncbi:hypothetical protein K7432_002358 [Basidiobolus ranarum]|uniref:Uncharacterized protein n=1 Tax=Basidiobolus ranarum TaxID=34480 RepID=A0ABR2X1M0_9FUNG